MGKLSAAAQQSGDYELPEEGQYTAVLCDWIDLGWRETNFGLKPQVKPVFQLDEANSEERRFLVYDFPYTISLDKKANLTKMLTAWLTPNGFAKFIEEDRDLDELIGVCASVSIVHGKSKDGTKTFPNIGSIMPLGKRMPQIEVEEYTRLQDSDKWAEKQPTHSCWGPKPDTEADDPEPPKPPVKRGQFVPNADETPEPRRSPMVSQAQRDRMEAKPPVDKHDFEAAQARAQKTISERTGVPEGMVEDEDDPFADGG